MAKTIEKKTIDIIKQRVMLKGGPIQISSCPKVLLAAANFGKAGKEKLVNAAIAAECFYQALHSHYWPGKGKDLDVILGDYYGSIAVAHASKLKDTVVLSTFCQAIQEATKDEDDNNKAAGRLAKICGASAVVGAYLAGLRGDVLDDLFKQGEQQGLEMLLK